MQLVRVYWSKFPQCLVCSLVTWWRESQNQCPTYWKVRGLDYIHTYLSSLSHHHLSLNCEGRRGTTDDFATSFLHSFLFSTALWDLANSRPVHSVMLSSHLFLCLPCLFPPFTARWFWPDLRNGSEAFGPRRSDHRKETKSAMIQSCLPFIRSCLWFTDV